MEYVLGLAEAHGWSFTAAVMECIACRRHMEENNIHWEGLGKTPLWASEIKAQTRKILTKLD
jgi:hypothetical protein